MTSIFLKDLNLNNLDNIQAFLGNNGSKHVIIVFSETEKYGMMFVNAFAGKNFDGVIGLMVKNDANAGLVSGFLASSGSQQQAGYKLFQSSRGHELGALNQCREYVASKQFKKDNDIEDLGEVTVFPFDR